MRNILLALALGAAAFPSIAMAQSSQPQMPPIVGTRLDVTATGEATRVPDVAIITAGVATRSSTAGGAIQENSARMPTAKFRLIPESADTHGHGTHTWATFWKQDLSELLARSE